MTTEAELRRIALSLPETTERPSYGSPGFRVRDRLFLRIRGESEGGVLIFVADLDVKEQLLRADPAKFFTTPHYDGHPSVLVRLDAVGVAELRELVTDSWLARAPKIVLRKHRDEVLARLRRA